MHRPRTGAQIAAVTLFADAAEPFLAPLSAASERGKARAGNLRHPFVTRVGNNVEQLGDSFSRPTVQRRQIQQGEPGSN